MEIHNLVFERNLVIEINQKKINLTVFKTEEHGNIKFGIEAPSSLQINREEVYFRKQKQLRKNKESHEVT